MTDTPAMPRTSVLRAKRVARVETRPLSVSVRNSAVWNVASTLTLRVAGILVTAIVAHILDPHDFGVFAVALTAFTIVTSLGDFGITSCLARADLDINLLAPTLTSVSLAMSALLAGAMTIFARPIAAALGSADAAGPVRVMALTVIVVGVFAVPSAQYMRDLRQDKLFLANAVSFIPSTIVLLILAKSGSGAMAFAWSRVAGQFASGCVLAIYLPRFYWPSFARSAMSILFRFGLALAFANFVNYILLNVDYALVGHLMGAARLGIYMLAFNVASWPASLLGGVINSVSIPAFSRVMHDPALLMNSIINSVRAVSLIAMPMCGLIVALSRPIVLVLYGARWLAAANVLSVLAFYGAVSIICVLFANMLASLGKSKLLLILQLVWLAALAPAMDIGVHRHGIFGAAVAHVVVIVPIVMPCYLFALKREAGIRLALLGKAAAPAFLAALAASLAARAVVSQLANPWIQLAGGLVTGALVYVVGVAPQSMMFLRKEQAASQQIKRIIYLYQMAGLPIGHQPKHAARRRSSAVSVRAADQAATKDNRGGVLP
jgi:lipopolysaccharide exporter